MSDTVAILDRLVSFDTVSANPNLELVDFVQSRLSERGFEVARLPDDTGRKAGLLARSGPGEGGILLSAHSDTVPASGQDWIRPAFRMTREGGRLYGRGTTDMKGFLASMLSLADRAATAELAEPLMLSVSYDEEVGCLGMSRMIGQAGPFLGRPRACIVGEPTEMRVAVGHKGKRALRATCHGTAGHSAHAPRHLNALHLAVDLVGELREMQAEHARSGARLAGLDVPHATFHAGRLEGGTALNVVPDRAELEFEFRHPPGDDADAILDRVREAADRIARGHAERHPGARIDLEETISYPAFEVPEDDGAVRLACRLSGPERLARVAFGTEAGIFQRAGIPTVVCGPGSMDRQGHKPDEWIAVSQLAACDAMMDGVLAELTG